MLPAGLAGFRSQFFVSPRTTRKKGSHRHFAGRVFETGGSLGGLKLGTMQCLCLSVGAF